MKRYKVAIIGSGSLATIIAEAIHKELSEKYELLGVFSKRKENSLKLSKKVNCNSYKDLSEMINDNPDYIIEAASPKVVEDVAVEILSNGINLIPLSVGAFAKDDFYKLVEQTAMHNNSRVHIPSGAVGGFDVLSSSILMEDADISITTEKAPKSLDGAPYLEGRKLSETKVEKVFRGTAREAIKLFPKNINVAVATALATTGVDNIEVTINSIPDLRSNNHKIRLVGETVDVNISIETKPSADNPKSSTLAAYSVIALLKNLASYITF